LSRLPSLKGEFKKKKGRWRGDAKRNTVVWTAVSAGLKVISWNIKLRGEFVITRRRRNHITCFSIQKKWLVGVRSSIGSVWAISITRKAGGATRISFPQKNLEPKREEEGKKKKTLCHE